MNQKINLVGKKILLFPLWGILGWDEECKKVVDNNWSNSGELAKNTKNWKNKKLWSRKKFKGYFKQLREIKNQLSHLKNMPPTEKVANQIWILRKEAESLLKDEESYW